MKKSKVLIPIAVLLAFALVFAGCPKAGARSGDDDDDTKTPFVGPDDDNPGGGAEIPAVKAGGKKYDLVLWEGYETAEQNGTALELVQQLTGKYYGDGKFNPSWFQPGIVLDLECNFADQNWARISLQLFDAEGAVGDSSGENADSDWRQQDGRMHNWRPDYIFLRDKTYNGGQAWSAKYPSNGFDKLEKIRIFPTNTSMVITKVTLKGIPLASDPAGWNNPGITEIAGEKLVLNGGKGTKADPFTAELEVPPSQINIATDDIKANYPMFANAAIYSSTGGFDGTPMISATFLPEDVPVDILIKVIAGDKTERYFKISVTRKAGYVDNGNGTVTRTVYSGSHTGTFNISKSGGRQYEGFFGGAAAIHGTMDFEYIIAGGYIEVGYTGSAPVLHLRSDQPKTGGQNDVSITGTGSSGTVKFDSSNILTQINTNFGYLTEGTRDPSVMAGLQITGAGSITKITIVYNPNDSTLKTFDTIDQMKAAAITFAGDTSKIKTAMTKAQSGQPITVVFLGGSITQAGTGNNGYTLFSPGDWIDEGGYAGKVAKWFVDTFKTSQITYVNCGYGGFGSGRGVEWLDTFVQEGGAPFSPDKGGLLKGPDGNANTRLHDPDIVFLEFAVNDSMGGWNGGGSGGGIDTLCSRILSESNAGVMVLCSLDFDNGLSADVVHTLAAKKHDVPVVNHRAALWPNIRVGKTSPLNRQELSRDSVHPNDKGHTVYADFIINRLEQIK